MGDFINECMSDLKTSDMAGFTAVFCDRCRQPGCERAKWAGDKFGRRVANQVDRLFHSEQADPTSSRYAHLTDFQDMMESAMRLELADRRGDWTIPEIPDFRSKPKDQLPKHMIYGVPNGTEEEQETPDPAKPKKRGPWIKQKEWDEQQAAKLIEVPTTPPVIIHREPEGIPATTVVAPKVGAAQVSVGNTPKAAPGGIMIGGEPPRKPGYAADPWAVPTTNIQIVKPGATIKMGGGPDKS
jgi:hypothetical protein